MSKTAVVIFNLGGPDSPDSVRPFLFNLFNDPAILRLPALPRWLLAKLISARRAPIAREIYGRIGGRSPILEETRAQAERLQRALGDAREARVFVAMRYWHPTAEQCIAEVSEWRADRIILLPLYPQFSTTTTGSFLRIWQSEARRAGVSVETRAVCCYPTEEGLITRIAELTRAAIGQAGRHGRPRVLFSAHGLPEKIVAAGDPYREQVGRTVDAVVRALGIVDLDYVTCFQSRVGPMKWLRPYIDEEVLRAGRDGVPVVVVPVAFVSEHSETLVELDIEYARLAGENGVPAYVRAPTVGADAAFIDGLARLVAKAGASDALLCSGNGGRICSARFGDCPQGAATEAG